MTNTTDLDTFADKIEAAVNRPSARPAFLTNSPRVGETLKSQVYAAPVAGVPSMNIAAQLHDHLSTACTLANRISALSDALLGPVPEAGLSATPGGPGGGTLGTLLVHGDEFNSANKRALAAIERIEKALL